MTKSTENSIQSEQIKNKNGVSDSFFQELKSILESDEYNIFKTRSKRKLSLKLQASESKIQKLLVLKLRSENEIKQLTAHLATAKQENINRTKEMITKMGAE